MFRRVSLRIWCNADVSTTDLERLGGPGALTATAELAEADVAFGQPQVDACLQAERLRWVHLNSAGWDKFDQARVRERFESRGVQLTTSSGVYREPCAQHVLALMLADARQLGHSFTHQATDRAWPKLETRAACRLLGPGSCVALVGYGSIAARVAELLEPFGAEVVGVRRAPRGHEKVQMLPLAELSRALERAEHVVNILPGGQATERAFGAAQLASMRPGATLYNIGRGSTVDQPALVAALESGHLRAAYLDVTEPEPLPPEHSLWRTPGCFITPHAAGGHADETARLLAHFEANLRRFVAGGALEDRVI
jgi:phosphoglycerate dehydrogenase-like enzyme